MACGYCGDVLSMFQKETKSEVLWCAMSNNQGIRVVKKLVFKKKKKKTEKSGGEKKTDTFHQDFL